jgi:hypothetical protein
LFKWRSLYSLPSTIYFQKFHHKCALQLLLDIACCSSECIVEFLYSCDNIHHEIEQFFSCIHFCSVHCNLNLSLLTNATGRSTAGVKDNIGRQMQSPVQWNNPLSENVRNRIHAHTKCLLRMTDIWPPRILIFPPGTLCTLTVLCTLNFLEHIGHKIFITRNGGLKFFF